MSKKIILLIIAVLVIALLGTNFIEIPINSKTTIRFILFAVIAGFVYFLMKEKKKE